MKDIFQELLKKNPGLKFISFWGLIVAITYASYFRNYWYPPANFWDEGYHIPAAAKYIKGVFFMEPHPPLGKLLIAAGEKLLSPVTKQKDTFGLEKTEQINEDLPNGFTPTGYRFFPVIFACLSSLVFTLILLELLGSPLWALMFSSLYLFDNAMITYSRGAMLDNFVIFGVLVSFYAFLKILALDPLKSRKSFYAYSFLMIFGFAFSVLTKAFALFIILLWPLQLLFKANKKNIFLFVKTYAVQLVFFVLAFHAVWFAHFHLGTHVDPLARNHGLYYASSDLEKIMDKLPNDIGPVKAFYIELRDNLRWFGVYENRITELDLKKGNANGSFPFMWPFGALPINFRWGTRPGNTVINLVLVANPVSWFLALLSLVTVSGVYFFQFVAGIRIFSKNANRLFASLLLLYFAFMIPMSFLRRILYLNHYLVPLLFTFFMLAVLWKELFTLANTKTRKKIFQTFAIALPVLVYASFSFYKPLTYMQSTTCQEANSKALFRFWDMSYPVCEHPDEREPFPINKPALKWMQMIQKNEDE